MFDVYVGHLYREGAAEPAYVFEGLAPDASGTLVGTWRRNGSDQKHAARLMLSRYDINQFAAGLEAWPEQAELFGRRGYTPPPNTQPPSPAPPTPAPSAPPAQTPPQSMPPPPAPSAQTPPIVSAGFKPLNRIDVRVDRLVVARGYPTHQVHAFVTVRNSSASLQYFTSGFVKVLLTDADGIALERSQPYRASGEPAALFAGTPVIQPGGELKVRYVFAPEPDARLTSLTLSEGGQRAEFPVGL